MRVSSALECVMFERLIGFSARGAALRCAANHAQHAVVPAHAAPSRAAPALARARRSARGAQTHCPRAGGGAQPRGRARARRGQGGALGEPGHPRRHPEESTPGVPRGAAKGGAVAAAGRGAATGPCAGHAACPRARGRWTRPCAHAPRPHPASRSGPSSRASRTRCHSSAPTPRGRATGSRASRRARVCTLTQPPPRR